VHKQNWLNCDPSQLRTAVRLINEHGRDKGERGLPRLLPGLNFIAGLNGETNSTYSMNMELLRSLRDEGLWLRRINIRQVEGQGFQEVPERTFRDFKRQVRETIDRPLLKEMLPTGTILREVWWEAHNDRIRRPEQITDPEHRDPRIHGRSGVTFGRQIGAYPILIGVPYRIPLETRSDILVTDHGMRSITGVEVGLDINNATQQQLEAIPGIGSKSSWRIVSARAKAARSSNRPFQTVQEAFSESGMRMPEFAGEVLVA